VPGDTISIDDNGQIIVNGKIPKDKGLVYAQELTYPKPTRKGYDHASFDIKRQYQNPLLNSDQELVLKGAFSLWPFKHHIKQHWGPIK